MQHELFLASANPHKRAELKLLLGDRYILCRPDEFEMTEVDETEDTLEGNALLKAKAGFEISGLATIADDTGLEVDALDGKPGVYSARYAGENATFEDNVNKLLKEMTGVIPEKRTARFRTVIVFFDGRETRTFEGVVEGSISEVPSGAEGFGYDPVFKPSGNDVTYAEMPVSEKNAISHRGIALRKFVSWISNNLPEQKHE